jgi:hypothetical protein
MHKIVAALGLSLGLLLGQTAYASAETPDAVIELSGGSVAAGVGFSWGSGTLIYQGKRYPLKINDFSLASVGVTEYAAAGTVSGLKTSRDINGVYTAAAAGASAMTNQSGVTIQMTSTSEGLNLTLAAEGVKIRLAE